MRGLGDASEYVMQVVRDFGFDPSQSSRLAQMRNLLRRGFIRETDRDFHLACEALRDITLLEFIFDQLKGNIPDACLRGKVERVVKDSPLPEDDRKSTPGRNVQAELHVAAVCQAAGLKPRLDEPDVVVESHGQVCGLAVKRFRSLKRLREHFTKATRQIENAGIPGFVVLDMVLAANPENQRLTAVLTDHEFRRLESGRFDQFLRDRINDFIAWRKGREVRGVILLDHVVCPRDSDRHWELRSWSEFADLDPYNDSRRKEAHRFWKEYRKGLLNPMNHPQIP